MSVLSKIMRAGEGKILRKLHRIADQVNSIEEDFIDLSDAELRALTDEYKERIAEALADEFAAVAAATGHRIEIDPNGKVPEAIGDETRALQIGRALLENAIRHTPPGTAIRLAASALNGRVVLSVEDDGPGIASEHAGQVFDRFFRIEGGHASGSGLGLAIARELADAMEGRLELDAGPGRTVFRLELPAATRAGRRLAAASGKS